MYNAEKYGYKFKVMEGYLFGQKNLLKKYVGDLYKIKGNTPRSDPMYLISKLLLNSVYGSAQALPTVGMDYKLEAHSFVNNQQLDELLVSSDIEVGLPVELDADLSLVSYLDKSKYRDIEIDSAHKYNISIAVSSAISAYSRVHMTQFKNNPEFRLFYCACAGHR